MGGQCPTCGKVRYLTKATAKKHARRHVGRGITTGLSAYRCGAFWHLGHLPTAVKTGDLDRHDLRSSR
jgi:hypothetical protein